MKKLWLALVFAVSMPRDLYAGNDILREDPFKKFPHVLCLSSGSIKSVENPEISERAHTLLTWQRFFEASNDNPKKILFIPYAKVFDREEAQNSASGWPKEWSALTTSIQGFLDPYSVNLISPYDADNPLKVAKDFLKDVDGIFVWGGNTFLLQHMLQKTGMFEAIQEAVLVDGKKYLGGSAGTNVATASIMTTNDTLICETKSTHGFGFLPFLVNVHYYSGETFYQNEKGGDYISYGGETRTQRLEQLLKMNKEYGHYVVLLREGTALERYGDTLNILGAHTVEVLFQQPEIKAFSILTMDAETLSNTLLRGNTKQPPFDVL